MITQYGPPYFYVGMYEAETKRREQWERLCNRIGVRNNSPLRKLDMDCSDIVVEGLRKLDKKAEGDCE